MSKFEQKPHNNKETAPKIAIELPEFKSTEEAWAFGKNATFEQIKALEIREQETLELIKQFSTQIDLKLPLTFKAQFDREAVDAWKKK